ncbi:hypothetical protein [Pusillimonas noertemannii]|uniref:Uncharacterized protein n=1 Tax=Pusillimonas noertemannii TaxID=305977 RepID=A0A2U1CL49_9BURK|nr:hypothetical protein [Pusillimonas noertemannii]NYT69269.1 hypothetical protein [Pusillimonas noertemannii]PVY61736.1 hypothetical protein C7440_2467 [Pusillimonas noertemannii]
MELIGSPLQLASAVLVNLIGLLLTLRAGRMLAVRPARAMMLYAWHSLFCLAYAIYATENGADALVYYMKAQQGEFMAPFGTGAVVNIATLFVTGLNLSFLGACLLFNIFGAIGLVAFDASLQAATADKSRMLRRFATLIVLLPSISFWSSALGKDSLAFMAAALALFASLDMGRRVVLLALAIFVMALVRPHIAGIMVIALAGSLVLQRRLPLGQRLFLGTAALAATAAMVPFALTYAGLGDASGADDIMNYVEHRQSLNTEGGSSVDIASMSLPLQLFSYLFRPLPFEAGSIFALAASMDNVVLIFLAIAACGQMFRRRKLAGNRAFMWFYCLLTWLILAITTANLGIAVRQKWMFAPILIYLFISLMGRSRARQPSTRMKMQSRNALAATQPYSGVIEP